MDFAVLMIFATPVALAAIGEAVGQRAGVINIGIEGMMLAGAYAAMVATQATGNPWLGLAAGGAVGVALALAQAFFTLKLAADQVVAGTALNLLSIGVTGTLFQMRYGASGDLMSLPKLVAAGAPDPIAWGTVVAAALAGWVLMRTRWGLAVRAAGEYPRAIEAAGYDAARLRLQAVAIGGLLAGIAGAHLAVGINGSFGENMVAGRGFVAIALVTFGGWRPLWVYGAALLVGWADAMQFRAQAMGLAVPYQLLQASPYLIALAVLVVVGRGARAPASLAVPYRREK